jgi:RNA polymerase sigma-70 factor (ECF subfamily)
MHVEAKVGSLSQGLVQYREMLFAFIYSLVRDVAAAEELFQEVAVIAMEKERKGDEVIREPARWLKEVVRRRVLSGFRTRQGRLISVAPDYLEQVCQGIDAEGSSDYQRSRLDALGQCLARVSPQNRALLRRRYLHGHSYEEIGKVVHRSPGALRVLIHRLQRQLAECIESRLQAAEAP